MKRILCITTSILILGSVTYGSTVPVLAEGIQTKQYKNITNYGFYNETKGLPGIDIPHDFNDKNKGKKENIQGAEKWIDEISEDWRERLSKEEKDAVKWVINDQSFPKKDRDINNYLSENHGNLLSDDDSSSTSHTKEMNRKIKNLDRAFLIASIPEYVQTYKKADAEDLKFELLPDESLRKSDGTIDVDIAAKFIGQVEGQKFITNEYQYTHLVKDAKDDIDDTSHGLEGYKEKPILIEFDIKQNTHKSVAPISRELYQNKAEGEIIDYTEMLINRGTNFKITQGTLITEKGKQYVKLKAELLPPLTEKEVIDMHQQPNWKTSIIGGTRKLLSCVFPQEKLLKNSIDTSPTFMYKVVKNGEILGYKVIPRSKKDGSVTVVFSDFNNNIDLNDTDHTQIYVIDSSSQKEYLVAEHKPYIQEVGENQGKIRFSQIGNQLHVTGENQDQALNSGSNQAWHILKDGEEVYSFTEDQKVKDIMNDLENKKLHLEGGKFEVTNQLFETSDWLEDTLGYSFEGLKLSALKIPTAKDIKYRVYVNENDIGAASPHKVYPDGSHEILFTQEYYNMDGWEIPKYRNGIKVRAEYMKNGKPHHHVVAEYVQK